MKRLAATVMSLFLLPSASAHANQAGAALGAGAAQTASVRDAQTITITRSGSQPSRQAAASDDGQLRFALSDGVTPARLSTLMALCRQEDPDIATRLSEVPLSQQLKGLHEGLYDAGFAQSAEVGDGILAEPAWGDPLRVVVPARHPLRIGRTNTLFAPAPQPPAAGSCPRARRWRRPLARGQGPMDSS